MNEGKAILWLGAWARVVLAVYWLTLAVASHWPRLNLGFAPLGPWQLDKVLHLLAYAGLTVLLLLTVRPFGRSFRPHRNAVAAALIAATYAVIDEVTQAWSGRHVTVSDLVANEIGVLGVFLIAASPASAVKPRCRRLMAVRVAWIAVAAALVWFASRRGADPLVGHWPGGQRIVPGLLLGLAMTWLGALAAPAGRSRPRVGILVTMVVVGAVVPMAVFTAGRAGGTIETADLFAYELGLLAALVFWALRVAVGRRTADDVPD